MNVCGEHVIVAYGVQNIDFSQMISLNESAAFLWEAVQGQEFTAQTLADKLCEEYEVDADTALADAEMVIEEWRKVGLAE